MAAADLFPDTRDIIHVLTTVPLGGSLDYLLPDDLQVTSGQVVSVPLGGREVLGIVLDQPYGDTKAVSRDKLKEIISIKAARPLPRDLVDMALFMGAYTLSNPASVARMLLSTPAAFDPAPTRNVVIMGDAKATFKATAARQKALAALSTLETPSVAELATAAGVSDGVVRGLIDAGRLALMAVSVDQPFAPPKPDHAGTALNGEQAAAAEAIKTSAREATFAPYLLHGVTGSGKTEVYFDAIADMLRQTEGQVLVMLPEIGLTSQWLSRFQARFGSLPGLWHSGMTMGERRALWRAAHAGDVRVVVGARSSLFLPLPELKLIIVDEEHDPSYKQEDGVSYQARDMAVVRARTASCPIVLASATPALESLANADQGRYKLLRLTERHGAAQLPKISPIDMRKAGLSAQQWLSPQLQAALQERLARSEQSLLFLNRRGYAPLTLCRTCGHRFQCPDCDAWLVEHRFEKRLRCHQCGFEQPTPDSCPACGGEDSLVACGPGVERLFEEVSALFPDARTAVLTSDAHMNTQDLRRVVNRIESGDVDIIIGTQLITKGYHFPALTLVGVVDADLGLRGGDLRAGERTWQQLNQVAGRAGRADKAGSVYLQTYEPEHPVLQALAAGDEARFLALEHEARRQTKTPPYGKLAAVIVSGQHLSAVQKQGQLLARHAPQVDGVQVYGPAPAPLARLRGQHRMRLLLHADKSVKVQPLIRRWVSETPEIKSVRIKIDIDPYSFL